MLNIGGIANISVLKPNGEVVGYDTGPGNMLMDSWCQKERNQPYDKDALWAKQGSVNAALLSHLKQDHYFALPAPKSTGRELFNLPWLETQLATFSVDATDVQRTLCEFTAQTIVEQVTPFAEGPQPQLLVCGGGAQNPLLMERLQALLPSWQVAPTTQMGVDGDNMEAMAFAWLAQRRMHGLPSNLPAVTGASRLASLGVIYSRLIATGIFMTNDALIAALSHLVSEGRNPDTMDIDLLSSQEIVERLNQQDKQVPLAVEAVLPQIAQAVDKITAAFKQGGRLIDEGQVPAVVWVCWMPQNAHPLSE